MGSLGIMFDVLRRQSGARRGRQRCRRRGHRDHGGQLQPTFRAEYGGLLRCRRCSRCLPASGQAGHRLGGCQVAWGARELRRRRPSQTPQWTPGRVPSAALPEAAAAFPSGLIVHVVVLCAGMNVSVVRSAGGVHSSPTLGTGHTPWAAASSAGRPVRGTNGLCLDPDRVRTRVTLTVGKRCRCGCRRR